MLFRRFLLLVLLVTNQALGEPVPGGEVRVERTERALACPSEQALVQAALAHGAAPPTPSSTPLEVLVQFDGDQSSLRALIRASGAKTGERVLRTEGADCAKLADAAAVVVAVLLDLVPPEAAASFDEPPAPLPSAEVTEPEPKVASPSPSPSPPTPPVTSPPRSPAAAPLSALFRGEGALTLGFLGGAFAPAVDVAASVRRGGWEGSLGGMWLASRDAPFTDIAGTKVALSLTLAFGEGCFALAQSQRGRWDGWWCGRVAAGRLTGNGQGFDHSRASHSLWVGAGPGLAFRLSITRVLSVRASLTGLVTLANHSFVVDGYGPAFDTPRFSAALGLGPELSIL
ncbi:MAG: hypothetical protein ABUL60_36315 [Myxococcales bacterium]